MSMAAYFQYKWGLPPREKWSRAFHSGWEGDGGPQTHVEGKEALYKGREIEDSHGEWIYRGCSEVRARVPQGLRTGQAREWDRKKKRASECSTLLSLFLLSHPRQSAPKMQQSAAMQKHPHSCLFHNSQYRGCLPKLNLQHMRLHKFASPNSSSTASPTPSPTIRIHATTSLPPHPAAEGDVFPQAITTVRC